MINPPLSFTSQLLCKGMVRRTGHVLESCELTPIADNMQHSRPQRFHGVATATVCKRPGRMGRHRSIDRRRISFLTNLHAEWKASTEVPDCIRQSGSVVARLFRSPRPNSPVEPTRIADANVFHTIAGKRAVCETATGVGPSAALKRLCLEDRTPGERSDWIEKARLDAILGGMRLSLPCLRTGLRCYVAFVRTRGDHGWVPIRHALYTSVARCLFP